MANINVEIPAIWPMIMAKIADKMVEMAKMTDAAMPAIWPNGSIDNAVRLPSVKPF